MGKLTKEQIAARENLERLLSRPLGEVTGWW